LTLYRIEFEPIGQQGKSSADKSMLECAHQLNFGIRSTCGSQGTCHSCKIKVLSGTVSGPTSNEREAFSSQELKEGWRLACQTYPTSDCKLDIPEESMVMRQRLQIEGLKVTVYPKPPVHAYKLSLSAPSVSDLQADADRLLQMLKKQQGIYCRSIDIDTLRNLSPRLRYLNWQCQVSVRDDEVIAIADWSSRQLGLAIDLGTTKIAGFLVDLNTGQLLTAKGIVNLQASHGADVISRISYAMKSPAEKERMQELAIQAINQLITDLCNDVGAETTEILEVVMVGNTAMHHLALCLPVKQLAYSPFVPAACRALDIKARDLGIHITPGGYVHLLPNVAGFVGADHVAMLLSLAAHKIKGVTVALDIGTNTEISLINNGQISTVSCASGPAFEGVHIRSGMLAASGAIEWVRIIKDKVHYQTIDNSPPIGICGSGILDTMAQLYLTGILDRSGKMKDNHPRVRTTENQLEFVLVNEDERNGRPAIVLTQQDIRGLQLAKAAIRTGIQVLLEINSLSEESIGQVIIAGAFGSYIDITSAITIGMLPSLPLNRFRQVGNAAGVGARLTLISQRKRSEAQTIAAKICYIELATAPYFMQTFIQAGYLGLYRMRNGKREEIDTNLSIK